VRAGSLGMREAGCERDERERTTECEFHSWLPWPIGWRHGSQRGHRNPMKKRHRPIGCAYGDQRRESHDDRGESPGRSRRHYRFAMKSLFMRAQQVAFGPSTRARGSARTR
jgi:hypothetical protein